MAKLDFNSRTFSMEEHESVLDCLLRNQQAIPYACKAGTCQACLIKAVDCSATDDSNKWLKQTLRAQGYALACKWVPEPDNKVSVRLPSIEEFSIKVSINSLSQLNPRTLRLELAVLEKDEMFNYFPGQYLTLTNSKGVSRPYSIANNYEKDQFIELHISQTQQGIFTQWLFNEAKMSDTLYIRGPAGDCFYTDGESEDKAFPMLLAGMGTGLAPLYGIINEALNMGHEGSISLFQGGRSPQHLYYVDKLNALQKDHPQFHYYPCVTEFKAPEDSLETQFMQGKIEEVLSQKLETTTLGQTKAFLCGNPDFVHSLRKKLFLQGVKSSNIFCDPFLERAPTPK